MDIGKELPAIWVEPLTQPVKPEPPTTPEPAPATPAPEREKIAA